MLGEKLASVNEAADAVCALAPADDDSGASDSAVPAPVARLRLPRATGTSRSSPGAATAADAEAEVAEGAAAVGEDELASNEAEGEPAEASGSAFATPMRTGPRGAPLSASTAVSSGAFSSQTSFTKSRRSPGTRRPSW